MPGWRMFVTEPHIVLFARTIVGLVLLIAGGAKLGDRRRFVETIRAYRLLPGGTATAVGQGLPAIEIVIAGGLLVGALMPWSALAALGLFLLFGGAVAVNLLRGRRDIDCGCFGSATESYLSWWLVGRNLVLLGLAGVAMGRRDSLAGLVERVSIGEAAAMALAALGAMGLWWLAVVLAALWHLPDPRHPRPVVQVSDDGGTARPLRDGGMLEVKREEV
jgi:hypothetical protein